MVGGNGPNLTWPLAAGHADELNLDGLSPAEVADALPVIRSRCEEIDRDPATLAVSIHLSWAFMSVGGGRPDRAPRSVPRTGGQSRDGPHPRFGPD